MKFATVEWKNGNIIVLENSKNGMLLDVIRAANVFYKYNHTLPETMQEIIEGGEEIISCIKEVEKWAESESVEESFWLDKEQVIWKAPIPRPLKNIFCVGKNYADHAIEMGSIADIPNDVMLFTKTPTTVIGHNAVIPSHADITEQMDYEGELAVVIGKKGKAIKKEQANEYIFGYTIINDVTARDIQARHKQFFLGKSLDGTCPMGPYIVHKSQISEPVELQVKTVVIGELRQDGNTKQFIFSIPEIIEVISKGMTLEPGDIIATGTPAGVGKGFNPSKFLRAGDVIEITIEQIGTLCNKID